MHCLSFWHQQIKNANTPPQIFAKIQTMQTSFCFLTFIRKSHFEYLMVLQTSAWSYARLMQFTCPLKNASQNRMQTYNFTKRTMLSINKFRKCAIYIYIYVLSLKVKRYINKCRAYFVKSQQDFLKFTVAILKLHFSSLS